MVDQMVPTATHIPLLCDMIVRSAMKWPGQDTAELGCGWYSTPMMAAMAKLGGYRHFVYTTDRKWGDKFCKIAHVEFIRYWDDFILQDGFRLVLQDSEELEAIRITRMPMLLERAPVVVFHDANQEPVKDKIEVLPVAWHEVDRTWSVYWTWAGGRQERP